MDCPMLPRVLLAKIRPPTRRADHIERRALVERVLGVGAGKWALLLAPLGYGKSVLAAEVARASDVGVAWIGLDDRDDLASFAAHVAAALGAIDEGSCSETKLALDTRAQDDDLAVALSNDLVSLDVPCVLVVDGLQTVASAHIERALFDMATHGTGDVRLVVATRSEPATGLQRIRTDGSLVELRASELAFDEEEIARFFFASKLPATEGEIRRVLAATHGWPLAVQLVAAARAGRVPLERALWEVSNGSDLIATLTTEVLDGLPDATRSAALDLAPLERVSAPLVEALIPGSSGEAVLSELGQANAFLREQDAGNGVWVANPVWRGFLLERARRERGAASSTVTLTRAAEYYARAGLRAEAIDHSLLAGDRVRAEKWIDEVAVEQVAAGEGATVLDWLERLAALGGAYGDTVLCDRLEIARAWSLLVNFRWREADAIAETIRARASGGPALGHAAAIRGTIAFASGQVDAGDAFAASTSSDSIRAASARARRSTAVAWKHTPRTSRPMTPPSDKHSNVRWRASRGRAKTGRARSWNSWTRTTLLETWTRSGGLSARTRSLTGAPRTAPCSAPHTPTPFPSEYAR